MNIYKNLANKNVVCTEPYSLAGRSTEQQFIEFYRNIRRATNNPFNTDIYIYIYIYIYIDMAKEFDKVFHSKLILEKYKLEIGGNVYF